MFIVLEGIDGSGKGTQVVLVKESLEKLGKKVKIVDYPRYGNPGAFFVEKYLNGDYGTNVSAKTASLFYALDRYDSSFELVEDLKNYDYIVANRYVSSNMVHQSGKIKDYEKVKGFLDWLLELEFEILAIPKPDKVIFLDVNPQVSQKLIEKKEKRDYIKGGENKDIHEKDENHLQNAYNAALKVAHDYNWEIINCVKNDDILPKEEITKMILEKIIK
nr:deoxynucleoside kinase [Candidatus Gracilibacteria bacterium]